MLIVSYDLSNDRTRNKFSKFLLKYGRRIQYSVYEIRNSSRILQNILNEIEFKYKQSFTGADSVIIFKTCKGCDTKIKRYGFSANEEELLFFG